MYYGLDVHKNEIQVCKLISEKGNSYEMHSFKNNEINLKNFAKSLRNDEKVVFEASFSSWIVHYYLRKYSKAKIVVANAHKVKMIAHARIKSDKVDAMTLAKLLRADFIPEVIMPDEYTWEMRETISHRRFLVKQRTAFKNTIRSILLKNLIDCPFSSPWTQKGKYWLHQIKVGQIERVILDNSLGLLEKIENAIKQVDLEIEKFAKKDKNIMLLLSIPGIDLVCATGLMAVIGEIDRFESPQRLASYFGIVPSLNQSGDKCYHGRITKEGSSKGRWLITEAAQAMALTNCPLVASFHRIKTKKGHNKAIVALARKMIVVVWHLLKKQEPYRYAPPARTREKLRKLNPKTPYIDRKEVAKKDIQEIYQEFNVKCPFEPSKGEIRAAINNKKTITKLKKNKVKIEIDHHPISNTSS